MYSDIFVHSSLWYFIVVLQLCSIFIGVVRGGVMIMTDITVVMKWFNLCAFHCHKTTFGKLFTHMLVLLLLLHPFNGLFFSTVWVSQHQKGKPFWILLEQEMMGLQWHQVDHMQITCTSLQTDNHASTSPLSFYRPDALPAAQPTASKHWSTGVTEQYNLAVFYMQV